VKRFDQFRSRREKIYEGLFSARALCIAGLLAMPALLFNPIPLFRIIQFLFYWFLCWFAGKKNNPLITILIFLFIAAFNLIVPYGRVLYSIGKFNITFGALMTGIERASTLMGLIMLSRFSIRRDLKFPGAFGELIGESFRFFTIIMESKKRISRKNLIGDIDQLMIDLSAKDDREKTAGLSSDPASKPDAEELKAAAKNQNAPPAPRTGALGFAILVITVITSWLPWVPLVLAWIFH